MMIMNVVPIGFFFPKQDFVQPLEARDEKTARKREVEIEISDVAVDDNEAKSFAMPLYAYRFF
jgi:hypothetical protein